MSAQGVMRDANNSRMILTVLGVCLMPSVRRCWKMAYIMWMASSATRSITTDLSSRVACMQQASPARTVITLIQGSCAKQEICSAGSATPPSDSTSVRIAATRRIQRARSASPAICQPPPTWASTLAAIIQFAFLAPIGRSCWERPTRAINAIQTEAPNGPRMPSTLGILRRSRDSKISPKLSNEPTWGLRALS